jgi:hypothetical protein
MTLRKELLHLAHACGEQHPALVPLERFAILDGLSQRPATEVFGYQPGWGLPSVAEREAVQVIMRGGS